MDIVCFVSCNIFSIDYLCSLSSDNTFNNYFIVLIFIRSRKYNADALNDKTEYIDANGYNRDTIKHSNLTHRNIAYYSIYLKHKDKYPLPFRMYQVHHKDHNKLNNNVENLEIFTKEEHQAIHKKR